MRELPGSKPKIESRLPVVLSIVAVLFMLRPLPSQLRVFPPWVTYLLVVSVIAPMLGVSVTGGKTHWMRFERVFVWNFVSIMGFAILYQLRRLLGVDMRPSMGVTGLQLLTSSVALWATNVLIFSIIYWRTDRGGPEARTNQSKVCPDWQFPQEGAPNGSLDGWLPTYVDYLFLAYCTATAFSPADVQPLTPRAKLLMMLESMISLVTILAIASRAINTLGN